MGADGGDPTGVDPDGEHVNVAGAHACHTSLFHVVFQRLTPVAVLGDPANAGVIAELRPQLLAYIKL